MPEHYERYVPRIHDGDMPSQASPLFLALRPDEDNDPALFLVDENGFEVQQIAYFSKTAGLQLMGTTQPSLFKRAGLPCVRAEDAEHFLHVQGGGLRHHE